MSTPAARFGFRGVLNAVAVSMLLLCSASFAETVDVMTYNIRYDTAEDGVNQWSRRKAKVLQLINKYQPTVIGIQEALHHQLTDLQAGLNRYGVIGVGRDNGKQAGEYAAIFYCTDLFDVMAQGTFWLSETPEVPGSKGWDAAVTRIATWAILRDRRSQQRFAVINTHFDHEGKNARIHGAELIAHKILELAPAPLILLGDLNSVRTEQPYSILTSPSTRTLMDPAPPHPPGTYCGFVVNAMQCEAIDYILHTQEWVASQYSVIGDHVDKYYPSDHLPVFLRLQIKVDQRQRSPE